MSKKKGRKRRTKLILLIELILVLILIPVVYFIYQIDRIPSADMNLGNIEINDLDNQDMGGYRNIVLFGVDSRANDLKKNTRSDSIIVASINRKTKEVKIVSLYRDTYVHIDGHNYTKLNHSYAFGGPELAISTINKNFDLDIKDFVTVNFSALANVIDKLGGITINIESQAELKEVNAYTRDVNKINGTHSPYLKTTGKQVVDGNQATAYCRVRYTAGGDYKRTERQRIVIEQIMKKAKSSSIPTLLSVVNDMIPQIYTSLNTQEIIGLAKDVFSYDLADTKGFPFENQSKRIDRISYVVPTTAASNVTELHKYLFGTENYKPSPNVLEYSNYIEKR